MSTRPIKTQKGKTRNALGDKEEVKNQFDAGFLEVAKYLEWVANIVPVLKKDER